MKLAPHHRVGSVAIWLLLVLPIALAIAMLVVYSAACTGIVAKTEQTAEAAAAAGARRLADDELLKTRLYGTSTSQSNAGDLLEQSSDEASRLAFLSPVYRNQIRLKSNPRNKPEGEIVFGSIDHYAFRPPFQRAEADSLAGVNAVRVSIRRTGEQGINVLGPFKKSVHSVSTAMLDGDVVGFKPLFADQRIPLAPIAVRVDDWQRDVRLGRDFWSFDAQSGKFDPSSDGLREVKALLTRTQTGPGADGRNSALLYIVPNPAVFGQDTVPPTRDLMNQMVRQFAAGVAADDLHGPQFPNDDFALPPGINVLKVRGSQSYGAANAERVVASLKSIVGQQRVFPLYTQVSNSPAQGDPTSQVIQITGFAAGRVVRVDPVSANVGKSVQQVAIRVTIQPTLLETPTAVTDYGRRQAVGGPNPYIAKVRLAN